MKSNYPELSVDVSFGYGQEYQLAFGYGFCEKGLCFKIESEGADGTQTFFRIGDIPADPNTLLNR